MFKKKELLLISRDRLALSLLIVFFLSVLTLLIMTIVNVRPTDIQVPIRYSGYGFTNLYRDQWYTLLSFSLFGIIIFITNTYLAIKLYGERRGLAIGILTMSILTMVLTLIIANAIFRLAAFSL